MTGPKNEKQPHLVGLLFVWPRAAKAAASAGDMPGRAHPGV